MSNTQEDRDRFKERLVDMLDGLRKKALAAIDKGEVPEIRIDSEMASFVFDGRRHHVPTGEKTYTVTIRGMTHGEAIEIAEGR